MKYADNTGFHANTEIALTSAFYKTSLVPIARYTRAPLVQFKGCRLALERLTPCPHTSYIVCISHEQESEKLA